MEEFFQIGEHFDGRFRSEADISEPRLPNRIDGSTS